MTWVTKVTSDLKNMNLTWQQAENMVIQEPGQWADLVSSNTL